jgi:hypothetical protein
LHTLLLLIQWINYFLVLGGKAYYRSSGGHGRNRLHTLR